jgi:hypothetical protein
MSKLTLAEKSIGGLILGLFVAVMVAGLMALSAALDGVVIATIWNWFMPSIFPELPMLTVVSGIAIDLVWTAISYKPKTGTTKQQAGEYMNAWLINRVLILVMAYVLKTYFMGGV